MSVLYIVLPLALVVVLVAVVAYVWAARTGQFDDLTTPALRALHDDEQARGPSDLPSGREGQERTWARSIRPRPGDSAHPVD